MKLISMQSVTTSSYEGDDTSSNFGPADMSEMSNSSFLEWQEDKIDFPVDINSNVISSDCYNPRSKRKLKPHSLVILVPSPEVNDSEGQGSSSEITRTDESSWIRNVGIQTDSGVSSSPSPPKTPTPDYDDQGKMSPTKDLAESSVSNVPKKVHFSNTEEARRISGLIKYPPDLNKSTWRDVLVEDLYHSMLVHCYRQEWVFDSRSSGHYRNFFFSPSIRFGSHGRRSRAQRRDPPSLSSGLLRLSRASSVRDLQGFSPLVVFCN